KRNGPPHSSIEQSKPWSRALRMPPSAAMRPGHCSARACWRQMSLCTCVRIETLNTTMATGFSPPPMEVGSVVFTTMADLQSHLGDIPAERIRLEPHPGSATDKDVLRILA